MELSINKNKLLKKTASEVVEENLKKMKLESISYVEKREMKEIEDIFGTPERYKNQVFIRQEL